MKKESPTAQTHFNAQNFLDEEGILGWITRHANTLFLGSLVAIALLFTVYQMSSRASAHVKEDYLKAAQLVAQIDTTKSPQQKEEAVSSLLAILQTHPQFNPIYQGDLTQTLFELGNTAQALPLGREALKRVSSDDISLYLNFASTTLLIEEKKYEQALTDALKLKEQVKENDLLNALNLVRVALLQQQLGDRDGELLAWKEWKKFAGGRGIAPEVKTLDPKIYFVVQNYYGQGALTLADYIDSRMGVISNK